MKVLAITDTLGLGGAERLHASLLPRLAPFGISCEVAALMPPYTLADDLERRGIPVHRLDLSHQWSLVEGFARLNRLCSPGCFEILWASLYFGQLYASILRSRRDDLRLLVWLHSEGYTNPLYTGLWSKIRRRIHARGLRCADRIVAVSRAVADDYEKSLGVRNIGVIYNGIPMEELPPPIPAAERRDVRRNFNVPNDAPLLTVPARFALDKGHRYLFDALSILTKATPLRPHCVLAGVGPLEAQFRAEVERLGLAELVHFGGGLEQQNLFKLMQASDAVVLPSLQEPFGLAVIEAMALGTPTVISDHYGLGEVAEGPLAFKARPGDAESLADALRRALTDEPARLKMAQAARPYVKKRFAIEKIATQWAKLLAGLAGEAP